MVGCAPKAPCAQRWVRIHSFLHTCGTRLVRLFFIMCTIMLGSLAMVSCMGRVLGSPQNRPPSCGHISQDKAHQHISGGRRRSAVEVQCRGGGGGEAEEAHKCSERRR